MRKLLLICSLFVFYFSPCSAQDTLACRNGKKIVGKVVSIGKQKVVYMVLPDSSQRQIATWRLDYIVYPGGTKFDFTAATQAPLPSKTNAYLSYDQGFSVPVETYKDAIVGPDFDIKACVFFSPHVGITLKAGGDFNSTEFSYLSTNEFGGYYIFQHYLAGITYRIGGKPGFPFVDFVGLGGICSANSPAYEQGGGVNGLTVTTPGTGTGVGGYFGIAFTSSSDHFCSLTFGAGCLAAFFNYAKYTSTFTQLDPTTNLVNNTVTKDAKTMNLELFQMYVGINFRVKKAGR